MKVFIACLGTETNTFSNMPTGEATFAETMLHRGDGSRHGDDLFAVPLAVWRRATEALQGQVVESLAAFAQPAGITVRHVYEGFRDEILDDLRAALPVDLVLFSLHGAMVADGYDDCEGDLLSRAREIAGPDAVIGAELDLHCSLTATMLASADVLVTFKEYPHIDARERAVEVFDLCLGAHRGEIRPTMASFDTRMVSMWRTPSEPAAGLVRHMQALEDEDGVLSVSLAHGFPWGDVADVSARVLVVTDGDGERAARLAADFGRRVWELREQTHPTGLSIDGALDRAVAAPAGPVVLADMGDNAGVGAPSDSTFVLHRVLDRGIGDVLTGLYWDPVAVRFCQEAGEGAQLDLRIGGKVGPDSGDPVDLKVTVRRIVADARQSFGGSRAAMGDSVWVSAEGGLDIVLNSIRVQTFHPDAFSQLGLDPTAKRIVVVKSTQHFHAGFAPMAAEILYIAGPGAMPMDFANIDYRKFTAPFWPRVEDPFAGS